MRIHFTIPVAIACILLAHGTQAQSGRIGHAEIYPDPVRTPGAANPDVTQENIKETICNRHWSTKQIPPPAQYTSKLKRQPDEQRELTLPWSSEELLSRAQESSATPR